MLPTEDLMSVSCDTFLCWREVKVISTFFFKVALVKKKKNSHISADLFTFIKDIYEREGWNLSRYLFQDIHSSITERILTFDKYPNSVFLQSLPIFCLLF